MKVTNRVKVNASISATGAIELGTALVGYQAPTLAEFTGDMFPYLLTSADGSQFESGYFVQALEYPYTADRSVELSNVSDRPGGAPGFADSTTGLVFHGVVGATQLLASSGGDPATATSWHATAAGPNAHAKHLQSMALGYRMQTTMPGEFAFGRGERGASASVVGIECVTMAGDTSAFTICGDTAATMTFNADKMGVDLDTDSRLMGLLRVQGTVMVMDNNDWAPNTGNCQVYDVSCILSVEAGTPGTLVGFSATPLMAGGITDHALQLDYPNTLMLQNTGTTSLWAIGHLRITRIVTASVLEAYGE